MFKVLSDDLVSIRISRDFKIETAKGEMIVNKWMFESDDGSDDEDYKIILGNAIYEKMSDNEKDEFDDFVSDLIIIR